MSGLFRFKNAQRHQPSIDEWLANEPQELFSLARHWFTQFRCCGDDIRELIHDSCPVACVGDAAFGYVNVFKHHVNVGFFNGARLPDPHKLLKGSGKSMRHVKVRAGTNPDATALAELIENAYQDARARL